jgi:NAD(P)-dependent dehydrogenase (short-subunit alcohol dehydrogenase family)
VSSLKALKKSSTSTMNALQHPINSPFSAVSTAAEVMQGIDLFGKTAIVTGGYSGIGLETTRVLHGAGASVIVPARDIEGAAKALKGLEQVTVEYMDLMDPALIDAFAARFIASGTPLHILVNNAGIMAAPLVRDARGNESQFSTNHLGHFQLTVKLWPALQQAKGARIVAVSSWGHRRTPVIFEDPNFERRPYDRLLAYGQSKTANALFAVGADKRGKPDGIRAYSLHPGGIVHTALKRNFTNDELRAGGMIDEQGDAILDPARWQKTVAQGAATTVWCATSPLLNDIGGVYCDNCNIAPLVPNDTDTSGQLGALPLGVMEYATDPEAAERLWILSEALTGVK